MLVLELDLLGAARGHQTIYSPDERLIRAQSSEQYLAK